MSNKVTPTQLAALLAKTIPSGLPVLIVGAPGCGKTDISRQGAALAESDFMVTHPVVSDPTDFKGLPAQKPGGEEATFLPYGDLARMLRATSRLTVLIDDIGQATPAVQAACMQLLLLREIDGRKIPDCVTFLAASNRRTDRAGVSGILEPVKSRFLTIVELEPTLACLITHAETRPDLFPVEMIAFWRFREELVFAFEPSADMTNSPVPRTWRNVATILGLGFDPALEHIAIAGAIGEGAAAEFIGFLRLFRDLPDPDGILLAPKDVPIPDSPAALYAIATALGRKASKTSFGPIATYAQRLIDAGQGDFGVLLVRDCVRRAPEVQHTRAFIGLAQGELSEILTGANA